MDFGIPYPGSLPFGHYRLNIIMQVESEDYRVFMINSYSGPAKQIICEVYLYIDVIKYSVDLFV